MPRRGGIFTEERRSGPPFRYNEDTQPADFGKPCKEVHKYFLRLPPLFLSSGMRDACPIMARIALTQMTHNCDLIVDFVAKASELSKARGEDHISQKTWEDADLHYCWQDGMSTSAFWKSVSP